jgi:hypothetical protein
MTQAIPGSTINRRLGFSLLVVFAVLAATLIGVNRFNGSSANAQTGAASITIVKQGLVGTDTAHFTHDITAGGSFDLTAADNTETFSGLAAGTYHVTEQAMPGYTLTGMGCAFSTSRAAPSLEVPQSNTLGITVAEGQSLTCTFVNAQAQTAQNTVTISKMIDDAAAAEGSFDFTATWTAANLNGGVQASGNFTLDGGNGWTATTAAMDAGADYSVVENAIDATCDEGDVYRLAGYSTGATLEEASAAPIGDSASFTDLAADAFVVVHNVTCPVGNSSITIVKDGLTGDAEATFTHDIPGQDSDTFSLTATENTMTFSGLPAGTYHFTEMPMEGWTLVSTGCAFTPPSLAPSAAPGNALAVVLGDDEDQTCTFTNQQVSNDVTVAKYVDGALATSGSFTLTETRGDASDTSEVVLDASDNFQYIATGVPFGSSYSLSENDIDSVCDEGDGYRLAGYSVGATLEEALAATPTGTLDISSVEADTFVIVWNQDCANIASITIVKDFAPDAPGVEASFTVEGMGLEDFGIAEGPANGRTFDNLNAGAYTFTEDDLAGWTIQSIFCAGQSSPSNVLINLGGASATVALNPGDKVTCTFTNMPDGSEPPSGNGSITVHKVWSGEAAAGPDAVFTTSANLGQAGNAFTLTDDGAGGDMSAWTGLAAETFTFTETAIEGWTLTAINCTGIVPESMDVNLTTGTLSVDLADGANADCTFTNTQDEESALSPFASSEEVPSVNVPASPLPGVASPEAPSSSNLPSSANPGVPSAANPSTANTNPSSSSVPSTSNPVVTNDSPSAVSPAPVTNSDGVAPSANDTSAVSGAVTAVTPVAPSTGNATSSGAGDSPLWLGLGLAALAGITGVTVFSVARKR